MAIKVTVYGELNDAGFKKARAEIDALEAKTKMAATGFRGSMTRMGSAVTSTGAKVASGLAAFGLAHFLKESVDVAREVEESQGALEQAVMATNGVTNNSKAVNAAAADASMKLQKATISSTLAHNLATMALKKHGSASIQYRQAVINAQLSEAKIPALQAASTAAHLATKNAIQTTSISWEEYGARSDDVLSKLSNLSAFSKGQLRDALTQLTTTTGDANKSLDLMGVTADLARRKHMDLSTASVLVGKAWEGNITSLKKLGIALPKGSSGLEAIAALQKRVGGSAEEYGNSAAGGAEKFSNSMLELQNTIGTVLLPTINTMMQKLTGIIQSFQNLPGPVKNVIVGLGAFAAAALILSPFAKIIGGMAGMVKGLVTGVFDLGKGLLGMGGNAEGAVSGMTKFGGVLRSGASSAAELTVSVVKTGAGLVLQAGQWVVSTAAMVAHKVAATAVTVATGVMTAAQWALNVALDANPIGLIILAVVALVGVFVLAYTKVDWFRNFVNAAFKGILTVVSFVVDWIKDHWQLLLAILTGPIGAAVLMITTHWDTIKSKTVAVWNFLKSVFVEVVNIYKGFALAIIGFVKGVGDKIGDAITFVSEIPTKIKNLFSKAVNWLKQAGIDIVQGLMNGVGSILPKLGQFFLDKLPGWIVGPFKLALGIASPSKVFAQFGKNIADGLIVGTTLRVAAVKAAGQALAAAMKAGTKDALNAAIKSATDVQSGLSDNLTKLQDYFNRIKDMVTTTFDNMKQTAQANIDDLSSKLQGLKDDAASFAQSVSGSLAIAFASADGKTALEQFRSDIADGQKFVEDINQLRSFGLNETSLQNIIGQGVQQGKAIADSLLKDGQGGVSEVNALQAMYDQQVTALTTSMSNEKFGAKIATAEQALANAQSAYASIAAQEQSQLDALNALGAQYGLQTDAMTTSLDASQKQLDAMLTGQTTATGLLASGVAEVTSGLLATAASMAAQAAALGRNIASLQAQITAAQTQVDAIKSDPKSPATTAATAKPATTPAKRAYGGSAYKGQPYVVGDGGVPELFVPDSNGSILPRVPSTGAPAASSGTTITVAEGAFQLTIMGNADDEAVQEIVDEAFAELIRQLGAQ